MTARRDREILTFSLAVDPFDNVSGDEEDIPIIAAIKGLQDALESVPEEFRGNAVLKLRAFGDWAYLSVEASFTRPETDDEMKARHATEYADTARRRASKEAEERELLARLKKKYEASNKP